MKQSKTVAIQDLDIPKSVRAIAYYRSSSEHQSEHSISVQQAHVRAWAAKYCIEILREYSDVGKSGSIDEVRPAFNEMMEDLGKCSDIGYVLCVDASRIGRFQEIDRSLRLSVLHNKLLIYTGTCKPLGDDAL